MIIQIEKKILGIRNLQEKLEKKITLSYIIFTGEMMDSGRKDQVNCEKMRKSNDQALIW